MAINRRALQSYVYMTVSDITFDAGGGDFAVGDEVVFYGTLEQAMVFAVKYFAVFSKLIEEDYRLVWGRNWSIPSGYEITPVTLLGETYVTPDEVALAGLITENYRNDFPGQANLVLESNTDPSTKLFYYGSRAALLAWLLQVDNVLGVDRIYSLYNFSIYDRAKGVGAITDGFVNILGATGPVEIVQAHETLVNTFASANILR